MARQQSARQARRTPTDSSRRHVLPVTSGEVADAAKSSAKTLPARRNWAKMADVSKNPEKI
jgi:hypothetical protein